MNKYCPLNEKLISDPGFILINIRRHIALQKDEGEVEETFWFNSWLWLSPDLDRLPHLGVIARENLESDRGDEFPDKVQPFLIEIDLSHMNVICRDTLIASSYTSVLQRENTMTGQTVNDKNRTIALLYKVY